MTFILAAAVLGALLAQTAEPTPDVLQTTYARGETLDYDVSWMKLAGGTARMTIGPSGDDRYRITSVARSGGGLARFVKVRDEIETIVSREDFSTLRYVKRLDERGDKMEEVTTIENGVATRKRKKIKKVDVPRPVLDPISVIYYVRRLDLTPGKGHDLALYADGKLYNVHARVIRRETITTPAGTFNCVLIEPEMVRGGVVKEERLLIWYSDDERRLPVRIRSEVKFGSVTVTLKRVTSGVTNIEPPALTAAR
jgi:hypothetical protein